MGLFGGGLFTPLGGAKVIQLNDTAGADRLIVKDADGFTVLSIDSKGNLRMRGVVSKTV